MARRHGNKDYYAILQVDPRAEPEVIEAAYRRLSLKYHPDVSEAADGGQRMRELNEAFEVLGDPARRRAYDRDRSFGGRPVSGPGPTVSPQDLLTHLPRVIALAFLAILSLRLLPVLLRPPILAALAVAALVYLFFRWVRRH